MSTTGGCNAARGGRSMSTRCTRSLGLSTSIVHAAYSLAVTAPRQRKPLRVVDERAKRIDRIAQGTPTTARSSMRVRALSRPLTLFFAKLKPGVPAILLAVTSQSGGSYLSHQLPRMDAGRRDAGFDAYPPPDIGPPPWCPEWGLQET